MTKASMNNLFFLVAVILGMFLFALLFKLHIVEEALKGLSRTMIAGDSNYPIVYEGRRREGGKY